MNRRQKIVLSVTGIFLLLLVIVGLTYAYFLTKIDGNDEEKSISVSTANLALVYGNDDGSVIGANETIIPGTTFEPKTFTVTNKGNATTDYVVVIEILEGTSTFKSNDFTYTLTCESGCNGMTTPTTFPINGGILVGNSIDENEVQTYSFTLTYNETGVEQSDDMNKQLNALINIKDISTINPYSDNTESLAYHIVNNSIINKNGTKLMNVPPTRVGIESSLDNWEEGTTGYKFTSEPSSISYYGTQEQISSCDMLTNTCPDAKIYTSCTEDLIGKYVWSNIPSIQGPIVGCDNGIPAIATTKYENVLSAVEDDYGTSYYYRGNVKDNYVNFNGMCWKIVRIEGDDATKLILEDQYTECDSESYTGNWKIEGSGVMVNYGKNDEGYADYSMGLKPKLTTWFNYKDSNNILRFDDSIKEKIKSNTRWCLGNLNNTYSSISPNSILTTTRYENITNNIPFYYETGKRLSIDETATLMCDNNDYSYYEDYIGMLTVDEVIYAGLSPKSSTTNMYLSNAYTKLNETEQYTLTLSSFGESSIFPGTLYEKFYTYSDYYSSISIVETEVDAPVPFYSVRPSISLISGIEISSGNGTITNPYTIK